jgi:hypothetical protein
MMGRKQAATSAPPISPLDLDGYARNPGGPADSIDATDLATARRARSVVRRREVAAAAGDRETELGEAIRATVEPAAVRDRRP